MSNHLYCQQQEEPEEEERGRGRISESNVRERETYAAPPGGVRRRWRRIEGQSDSGQFTVTSPVLPA